jgi:hypothetical protein
MSSSSSPQPPGNALAQLPADVLRLVVWDRLRPAPCALRDVTASVEVERVRDQHSLRSCCKALRDDTTPFIVATHIFLRSGPQRLEQQSLTLAQRQLAAFPTAATLRTLRLGNNYEDDDEDDDEPPRAAYHGRLATFFAAAHERLAAATTLRLGSGLVGGCSMLCKSPH